MNSKNVSPKSRARQQRRPTPEEYGKFVGQLDLADLWLAETRVKNDRGPRAPRQAALAIEGPESTWSNTDDGFDVRFPYVVRFVEGEEVHAEIAVTFGLHFTSTQPMTEEIFGIFKDVNLPVNTWPFLREFVSTTLGRMGWQQFTLPAYKMRVPVDEAASEPTSSQKRQKARAR